MTHIFTITGMTCEGCKKTVEESLSSVPNITQVSVDLKSARAEIQMEKYVSIETLQEALSNKYQITELKSNTMFSGAGEEKVPSKWKQLKPLFLIFAYLIVSSILLNYKDWNWQEAMIDFMGLFYIVFSFFKFLDLKGFPESFRMYDPLAKRVPIYGSIYPFIELSLGILFLMRLEILWAVLLTLIILSITTIGVVKTLMDKKSIRCACLGTVLNLPMTEATFIENAIMIIMGILMLMKGGLL